MDRLAQTFARCKAEGRPAFVSYVCAGDPDVETSKAILKSLAQAGADVLEVGVPFSDPLADGLTNQLASQRALESGMTFDHLLEIMAATRAATDKPIVLYCYYNPALLVRRRSLLREGQGRRRRRAARARLPARGSR